MTFKTRSCSKKSRLSKLLKEQLRVPSSTAEGGGRHSKNIVMALASRSGELPNSVQSTETSSSKDLEARCATGCCGCGLECQPSKRGLKNRDVLFPATPM